MDLSKILDENSIYHGPWINSDYFLTYLKIKVLFFFVVTSVFIFSKNVPNSAKIKRSYRIANTTVTTSRQLVST